MTDVLGQDGEKLKAIRKQLGWTQEKLARELGVTRTSISNIEQGMRKMSKAVQQGLQRRLGISTDFLLKGKGNVFSESLEVALFTKAAEDIPAYNLSQSAISTNATLRAGVSAMQLPVFEPDILARFRLSEMLNDHAFGYITLPFFTDCDLAMKVYGNHMHPKYSAGDWIILKKIQTPKHIISGEPYLVFLADYSLLCYIHNHPSDQKSVILKFAQQGLPEQTCKKSLILDFFHVKGVIKKTAT